MEIKPSGYENTTKCSECDCILTLDNTAKDIPGSYILAERAPVCKQCYEVITKVDVTCVKCNTKFTALPSTNLYRPVCRQCKRSR